MLCEAFKVKTNELVANRRKQQPQINTAVCVYVVCNVFCALVLAGSVSACDISHNDVGGHLGHTHRDWSVHEPVSSCVQNMKGTLRTTHIHTVVITFRVPVSSLDESCWY